MSEMVPGAQPFEARRKLLHLLTAALPIAWSTALIARAHVIWLLGIASGIAVAVELLRRFSPAFRARFVALFGAMLRPHESQRLTGATWLALAMLSVAALLPERTAIVALWAAAVGDASAALVGRAWKRARGSVVVGKTWAGSVAALAVTAAGAVLLESLALPSALVVGLAAALAERPHLSGPLGDDNIRVSWAAGLTAWGLGVG